MAHGTRSRTQTIRRVREADGGRFAGYRDLRAQHGSVYWDTRAKTWVVLGRSKEKELLGNPAMKSRFKLQVPSFIPIPSGAQRLIEYVESIMKWNDGVGHRVPKNAMSKPMSRRNVIAIEGDDSPRSSIRKTLDGFVIPARNSGKFELVHDIALPFPATVILNMIGINGDPKTVQRVSELSHLVSMPFSNGGEVTEFLKTGSSMASGLLAAKRLAAFMDETFSEAFARDSSENTPLMNLMVNAVKDGKLTHQTSVANLIFLLIAGHETTTNLITNGTIALLRNPKQMQLLREKIDDTEFLTRAVNEITRYVVPVQKLVRYSNEDVDIGDGQIIRKDDRVTFMIGASNRDPDVYGSDADELDLLRDPADHSTYGRYQHLCLGLNIAQVELEEWFRALTTFNDLRMLGVINEDAQSLTFYGAKRVPMKSQPTNELAVNLDLDTI